MRLTAEELEGRRGGRTLFAGLSFALGPSEALLVKGPNGAGKSTLLRVLAGLLAPAGGRVSLQGGSLGADAHYLSTENAMKPALTVAENLGFWRGFLAGARERPVCVPTVGHALEALGLAHLAALPFGVLSTGQRRRVGLARLLLDPRPLWLLDEPGSGLDAASSGRLTAILRAHLGEGGMLVAAVHDDPGLPKARSITLGESASGGIAPL
jgi:heme exporter protein A